jgi:hypothetical protein
VYEINPQIENKQLQNIKKDFKHFYAFLDEFFNKQGVFQASFDLLTQIQLETYETNSTITFQSADKATIYLHYQENILKRWTLQSKKKRKTIQMTELKEKLDIKKTRQSLKPNTTHAMDAALVRETLRDLRKPIMTIHDCYGVDIQSIDETIYSINKNINNIKEDKKTGEHTQWFSIFIVL